jgi:hypothetical protein
LQILLDDDGPRRLAFERTSKRKSIMPRELVVAITARRLRGVHGVPQRRQVRALDRERLIRKTVEAKRSREKPRTHARGRGHLVGDLLRAGGVAAVLRHDDARAVAARVVA